MSIAAAAIGCAAPGLFLTIGHPRETGVAGSMRMLGWALSLSLAMLGASPLAAQTAARAEARPHYIFFPWSKPDIDRDAEETLDQVIAACRKDPGARLLISGHADRSGSAAHNLRSSRRRADSVSDYLATRGVPRSAMTVVAHGEDRPFIPTEDGVREPQNRRVEIRFAR